MRLRGSNSPVGLSTPTLVWSMAFNSVVNRHAGDDTLGEKERERDKEEARTSKKVTYFMLEPTAWSERPAARGDGNKIRLGFAQRRQKETALARGRFGVFQRPTKARKGDSSRLGGAGKRKLRGGNYNTETTTTRKRTRRRL